MTSKKGEKQARLSCAMVWGSSTGYTEETAESLHGRLLTLVDAVVDIADTPLADLMAYDVLIVGAPTWHVGDLQDDWYECYEEIAKLDWRGKLVAFFGCGDAEGYPDNFQDAMGLLWQEFQKGGATLIGRWPIHGYDFLDSVALTSDRQHFVGLAIDEHSQGDQTEERLDHWARQIKSEMATALAARRAIRGGDVAAAVGLSDVPTAVVV